MTDHHIEGKHGLYIAPILIRLPDKSYRTLQILKVVLNIEVFFVWIPYIGDTAIKDCHTNVWKMLNQAMHGAAKRFRTRM